MNWLGRYEKTEVTSTTNKGLLQILCTFGAYICTVVILCSWAGNHRSGIALAMRHRLSGLSTYGFNDLNLNISNPLMLQMEHGTRS